MTSIFDTRIGKLMIKTMTSRFPSSPDINSRLYNEAPTDLPFFDEPTLCAWLGLTPLQLTTLMEIPDNTFYHRFYIDKLTNRVVPYSKTANLRTIEAPIPEFKAWLAKLVPFFEKFPVHPCNYAFIKGKRIKDAVESVKDGDVLIHTDLKDFFTNHTSLYIEKQLETAMSKAFPDAFDFRLCQILTKLLTVHGHLPQGSPCSPIVTAVLNYDMDTHIQELADKYGLVYMRYADDICFSGTLANDQIREFLDELTLWVHPFRLNSKKVAIMRDKSYPVFSGIKLSINNESYVPSELIGKLVKIVTTKFSFLDFESIYVIASRGQIHFRLGQLKEMPVDNVKTLTSELTEYLNRKYVAARLTFNVKPTYFYIKSIKQLLGMHIAGNKICYSRKAYNQLRLEAMLLGRQEALQFLMRLIKRAQAKDAARYMIDTELITDRATRYINRYIRIEEPFKLITPSRFTEIDIKSAQTIVENLSTMMSSTRITASLTTDKNYSTNTKSSKRKSLKGKEFRNVLSAPISKRAFLGRVNWVNTVDPEKSEKLKAIVTKYRLKTLKMAIRSLDLWTYQRFTRFSAN